MPEISLRKSEPDTTPEPVLKIHWRLCQGGVHAEEFVERSKDASKRNFAVAQPDLINQIDFVKQAERLGFHSLLVDFGINKPDPVLLSMALGQQTTKLKFIIACRSGLLSPTYFVQQLNTLSHFIGDRFSLNVVAGHTPSEQQAYGDFLDHDRRYDRTFDYLRVCRRLWAYPHTAFDHDGPFYKLQRASVQTEYASNQRHGPECFIAGGSEQALALAKSQGDTWVTLAQEPELLMDKVKLMREAGIEVCLRLSVICRGSREQAMQEANAMVAQAKSAAAQDQFVKSSDSVGIKQAYMKAGEVTESVGSNEDRVRLWSGAVKTHGAPSIAMVGSPEDVASLIKQFRDIGVSQFILSGWPQFAEMKIFGEKVMPLL